MRARRIPAPLALTLGIVLAGAGCGGGGSPPAGPGAPSTPASGQATPTPTPVTPAPPAAGPGAGTWRMLPAAPLPAELYVGVWTGAELILHTPNWTSGRGNVSAAYNPATNSWRRLPSCGYPLATTETGVQAVWSGTELLTWGVLNAAYDPATNRWRPLRAAPMGAPSVVVWTGSRALFWGGGCCDDVTNAGAAYDPVRDTWRPLPAAPLAARHTGGVWTGTEMIVVGGQAHGQTTFADAAAYNPTTDRWRMLPPLPAPRFNATVTWTGTEVLVVGGERANGLPYADGLAYNPATNRWRRLPSMSIGRTAHEAVWTGRYLLIWGGMTIPMAGAEPTTPPHGFGYDPATNRWSALPKAPLRGRTGAVSAWSGTEMLIWGGVAVASRYLELDDGAAYQP